MASVTVIIICIVIIIAIVFDIIITIIIVIIIQIIVYIHAKLESFFYQLWPRYGSDDIRTFQRGTLCCMRDVIKSSTRAITFTI